MAKKIMFSVILPIYNVEKYLDRCILSILNQTYQNFEIILVDDGSPDHCGILCDNWEKKDKRIKVLHKKNEGLGMARNSGFELAEGDYILFIDSDDYVDADLLSSLYEEISYNKSDIIFYGYKRVLENGDIVSINNFSNLKCYVNNKNIIKNELLSDFIYSDSKKLFISAWNCCYKKEMLKDNCIKFKSEREYISEDLEFHLHLFNCVDSLSIIEGAYYNYCQNEGSLTFSYKKDRFERLNKFYKYMFDELNKLEYDIKLKYSLIHSYLSCVISCLKMETANRINIGFKKSYKNFVTICNDNFMISCYNEYFCSNKKLEFTWKVLFFCIKYKLYFVAYYLLYIKYKMKGI